MQVECDECGTTHEVCPECGSGFFTPNEGNDSNTRSVEGFARGTEQGETRTMTMWDYCWDCSYRKEYEVTVEVTDVETE